MTPAQVRAGPHIWYDRGGGFYVEPLRIVPIKGVWRGRRTAAQIEADAARNVAEQLGQQPSQDIGNGLGVGHGEGK